jgi:Zn-dependent peptidase ImmA (M78 family)/transcriptional regulator with XRE-family HTH domain
LEDAAGKAGVSVERLTSWENGSARPSVAQLRKLASVYRRPLAVFYLPEPPRDFQPLTDYRRLPEAEKGQVSPELEAVIRRAHAQREAALELRELAADPVRSVPVAANPSRDPERFGAMARDVLGVSIETQLAWPDSGRALTGWITAIEDLDVMVLQAQRIDLTEMRGFTLTADPLPVIVLNGADAQRGRIFTLLHEFAHVLLSSAAGLCDLHDGGSADTDDIEVFCNRAAAATLLPSDVFRAHVVALRPPATGEWDDAVLSTLAERFSVSREVILRRLYAEGFASWSFLAKKVREYRAAYEEQARRRKEEGRSGPTYYTMRVRDLGRPYIRLALDAYDRDDINASELAEFLEVKLNNLQRLTEELARAEARRA